MLTWYRTNRIALIGVLGSVLFGGLEVVAYFANGVSRADLYTPVGVFVSALADLFPVAGADRVDLIHTLFVLWQSALTLGFTALLWTSARLRRASSLLPVLLAVQMLLAAFGLSALLYVLAAQLAVVLPRRRALAWLAVQGLLMFAAFLYIIWIRRVGMNGEAIMTLSMHLVMGLTFQVIAFSAARIALAERTMRLELAAANASLLATQSMLADTVRSSERNRIARDLHDAVGHHLTALNLHLDLALRQAGAEATQPLRTSRELARGLLSEVREVVSSERGEQPIELAAAIKTLCAGIPTPAITLHVHEERAIASPALAHTLFFCVQEALTNAVRHSGAEALNIALHAGRDSVTLQVDDDGHGTRGTPEGNGLRGMRERVAEQGGTLLAASNDGQGFRLNICLPLARAAA